MPPSDHHRAPPADAAPRPRESIEPDLGPFFEQFATGIDRVVWISDASLRRLRYISPAYERVWGRSSVELLRSPDQFLDPIHPDDRAPVLAALERHRRGESAETVYRLLRPDGTVRWIRDTSFPILDDHGRVCCAAGFAEDITAGRHDRGLLAAQRRILEKLAQADDLPAVPEFICREIQRLLPGDVCAILQLENERLCLAAAPSLPAPLRTHLETLALERGLDSIETHDGLPRLSPLAQAAIERANPEAIRIHAGWTIPIRTARRTIVGELLVFHAHNTTPSVEEHAVLQSGADLAGVAIQRLRTEERHRLMRRELDHRVKNNLAAVLSLARQTAATSDSLDSFIRSFDGRVNSMAIAHDLLAQSKWTGADLRSMARRITGAHETATGRAVLTGPPIVLPADMAPVISMVLHELTVNACKHGALSTPTGGVDLTWAAHGEEDGAPRLELTWAETGGPPIDTPGVPGLGLSLIDGLIRGQLRGRVEFDFARDGVQCRLDVPLPAATASEA